MSEQTTKRDYRPNAFKLSATRRVGSDHSVVAGRWGSNALLAYGAAVVTLAAGRGPCAWSGR